MSNPKWLIFIISVWVTLTVLGTIMEAAWFESGSEESTMSALLALPIFTEDGSVVGTVISPNSWGALYNILTLNFAFFTGEAAIIRWIIFLPLSAAFTILFLFFLASHVPIIGRGTSRENIHGTHPEPP